MKDFSLSKAESQHREMLQRRTEKIRRDEQTKKEKAE